MKSTKNASPDQERKKTQPEEYDLVMVGIRRDRVAVCSTMRASNSCLNATMKRISGNSGQSVKVLLEQNGAEKTRCWRCSSKSTAAQWPARLNVRRASASPAPRRFACIRQRDKNIYLPCIGWMVPNGAVVAGAVVYG